MGKCPLVKSLDDLQLQLVLGLLGNSLDLSLVSQSSYWATPYSVFLYLLLGQAM